MTVIGTFIGASPSEAYRPFVSTDAAVAAPGGVDVEFGYFGAERDHGRNSYVVPHVVLNYGLVGDLEAVGEFSVEKPSDRGAGVADSSVSLKAVLKEGALQEHRGVSLAVEAGPLLPATVDREKRFGFEGIGIMSSELSPLTLHLNVGGGVDRIETAPFIIWGVIAELPMSRSLRVVSEVNGKSVESARPDNSSLLGFIYQVPGSEVFFDLGIRKGFGGAAADWGLTTGVTFGFALSSLARARDTVGRR